jgi:putative aldouronate transport system permease protein
MKRSIGEIFFDTANYILLVLLGIVTLYPFLNVLAISLNESLDTVKGGIYLWPRVFTLANYREIFQYDSLIRAVIVSVLRTVSGTAAGIVSTGMVAFVLSREDFLLRKPVTTLFVITMYVSGGMIPDYLLVRNVGLMNNFLVYILPGLISVFNIFVLRSFIDGLPFELQESAKLDGANDFIIFFRIIFPLCLPVIATLSLFIAVGQWNSWFDTMLYAGSNKYLTTLQYELQKILTNSQASRDMYRGLDPNRPAPVSPESIQMAMTIVATVPILFVYPFVQKYFIQGLTLGSVKS